MVQLKYLGECQLVMEEKEEDEAENISKLFLIITVFKFQYRAKKISQHFCPDRVSFIAQIAVEQ